MISTQLSRNDYLEQTILILRECNFKINILLLNYINFDKRNLLILDINE